MGIGFQGVGVVVTGFQGVGVVVKGFRETVWIWAAIVCVVGCTRIPYMS